MNEIIEWMIIIFFLAGVIPIVLYWLFDLGGTRAARKYARKNKGWIEVKVK